MTIGSDSTIATLALFEAYHILLCRPYLFGGRPDSLNSLSTCIGAARNIVSQIRYLRTRFDVWTFPLTVQQ